MNRHIRDFAARLDAHAAICRPTSDCEWKLSRTPQPYASSVSSMETRVAQIHEGVARELVWLLEHPAVYTAGTSAKPHHLLDPGRFPVHNTGRGGQYTYHGPGQLVAYVLQDLDNRGRDVRGFVRCLEDWVIAALEDYGIRGRRRERHPGIWVDDAGRCDKIAAVGVRVRRWVTYHGVAINVCPDLTHFTGIVPCGIDDAGVTSIAALGALKPVLAPTVSPAGHGTS